MCFKKLAIVFLLQLSFSLCNGQSVLLTHGVDTSAGDGLTYIITTSSAVYYLEKEGGGLSSMMDRDGIDWIGFHNKKGSGWKGEYRGFPNAIHRQDGNYFHAMNDGTEPSTSVIEIESQNHVRIVFTSNNEQWQGQWDFYPDRCDFSMIKVSAGYKYWVQYEGVPGGEMDSTDFWYSSANTKKHPIEEPFFGDLPAPEWMAFGDENSARMLYMLHHEDDEHPDNFVSRPYMTVFGFGRQNKETTSKFLSTVQTFSIGFVESTEYSVISQAIRRILD
ncbi:hypothetical protein ACFFU9_01875 [Mariniflexile ostreae]|uniref:Uncharacterized protein n=1 Tax=Mariniflexile ostreae TaxID=1520892 RepID=A0ABV5F7P5_9FLAO